MFDDLSSKGYSAVGLGSLQEWEERDIRKKYADLIQSTQEQINNLIQKAYDALANDIDNILMDVESTITQDVHDPLVAQYVNNIIFKGIDDKFYSEWPTWYEYLYKVKDYSNVISTAPSKPVEPQYLNSRENFDNFLNAVKSQFNVKKDIVSKGQIKFLMREPNMEFTVAGKNGDTMTGTMSKNKKTAIKKLMKQFAFLKYDKIKYI